MNEHEGHDSDLSHEIECPGCGEIVRDPSSHHCIILKEQP